MPRQPLEAHSGKGGRRTEALGGYQGEGAGSGGKSRGTAFSGSSDEARENMQFLARLGDALDISEKRPCFLGFFNEHQVAQAQDFLKSPGPHQGVRYRFWGGHPRGERCLLGMAPDDLALETADFPVGAVSLCYKKEYRLSHREFLGSFLALGIRRDTVGDLLIEEGRCVAFLKQEILPLVMENIRKIGKVGVRLTQGGAEPLPAAHAFQELRGVVASERIDCVTAFLCRQSREKAAMLIRRGLVQHNHLPVSSLSRMVQPGDVLSVKGFGKFSVDRLGPPTAKGRLSLCCRKYI